MLNGKKDNHQQPSGKMMRRFLTSTACGIIFLIHSDMAIRADPESWLRSSDFRW
jgi:hypothetical protein